MKQISSIIVACLTLAASSSVFAVGGTVPLAPAGPDDVTYYFTGTGNLSGSITLDASHGSWSGSGINTLSPSLNVVAAPPVVSFDIVTPYGTLSSANASPTYITNSPIPSITWNATEITDMNMLFVDSDPFSLDIHFDAGNFNGNLFPDANGFNGPGQSSEDVNSGSIDAAAPDGGAPGFFWQASVLPSEPFNSRNAAASK